MKPLKILQNPSFQVAKYACGVKLLTGLILNTLYGHVLQPLQKSGTDVLLDLLSTGSPPVQNSSSAADILSLNQDNKSSVSALDSLSSPMVQSVHTAPTAGGSPENPDTHRCLIRFFHKVASMSAPTTDAEKLISGVVEEERPTFSQLHDKSLMEANTAFLEQHKDSLMHRAAVAEMIFCLEPNKKVEAIKLIEESSNNPVSSNGAFGSVKEWKLKECVAVHKLLVATLDDRDAALRWKNRCAEDFPYSTYFEGSLCSSKASKQIHENAENGGIELPSPNGKVENLEAMKNLAI